MTDGPMTDERLFDAEYMLQATGWRDVKIRQLRETIRLDREAMQATDTLIGYSWPLLARLRLRDRLEAKDE